MKQAHSIRIPNFLREIRDFWALQDPANKKTRTLTFYSEKDIYFQYFEGLIGAVLEKSALDICYITSDPDDPIFLSPEKRIKSFYIRNSLANVIADLDARALVMTMPDLDKFQIRRSPKTGHCVYIFHGVTSTHFGYRFGALDHYDALLCVGPHQVEELRKAESLYGLKPRELVECGYHRVEKIYREHRRYLEKSAPPTVLVAPTWGENSIFETCLGEVIAALARTEYRVVVRPHPESIKRRGPVIRELARKIRAIPNMELELDLVSDETLHRADVLITDTSAISFEYAFGTERPVIFIDIPLKKVNPRYEELGIEAMEVLLRDRIGLPVPPARIPELKTLVAGIIDDGPAFRERIIESRQKYLFNWMRSSEAGADFLIGLCTAEAPAAG